MKDEFKQLIDTVQHNCHISDARYAGNYTLCIYLLKMREYYRWEQSSPFNAPLSKTDIGNWLSDREVLWDKLENEDYQPLKINTGSFDPFQNDAINQSLISSNLIYSGGYGVKSKPHFFLAQLQQHQHYNGYNIYISNKEYARDLTAPPAMSHNNTIYIRRESLKRMLWERTEEWRWNKPQNAMANALACYDFDNNLEDALNAMTSNELNTAVLHEIGEIQAGERLSGWQKMMHDISFTQAEIMARAVRDHFADTLHTLPVLLESNAREKEQRASIHFYFANLTHMRKHIFPSLMNAYQQWLKTGDPGALRENVSLAKQHWKKIAQKILALHTQKPKYDRTIADNIESLVKKSHL